MTNNEIILDLEAKIKVAEDKNNARNNEYDRIIKRLNNDYIVMKDNGTLEVANIIIEALDNLSRALLVESSDKKYFKELKKLYKKLNTELTNIGIVEVDCEGKNDPNVHHAVAIGSESEFENDMILEVFQKGYVFKEKLIRPAMVKVNQK